VNPKQFLIIAGAAQVLLSLVGFLRVFGPETTPFFWLDNGQNVVHLWLGLGALAMVFIPALNSVVAPHYKSLVVAGGVMALSVAAYGFLVADAPPLNTFGLANLENPSDNLLHLIFGAWALLAAFGPSTRPKPAG